jgi:poly-gamma-glutamate synthesis protein (capsule biosynthesis protein)
MNAGADDLDVTLFLCGDVMTGRGIDQILPHPCHPRLHEDWAQDAREYVALAEHAHGPVRKPVGYEYVWGDALAELDRVRPDARIVNLETSLTRSDAFWPGKGIHYRTSPENARCLAAARLDVCGLANNHVLDWGHAGLEETLRTLDGLGIAHAGAGRSAAEAAAPGRVDLRGGGRVLVFAFATGSSGVPESWAATGDGPGVAFLPDLSSRSVAVVRAAIEACKRAGDVAVASLHWGGNWGYATSRDEERFARALIDEAGADVVHGHSSHHPKPIEVHHQRLILYGCGDLLTDYEGIAGYEEYRGGLGLMYFPRLDRRSGRLRGLMMTPTRLERLQVIRASAAEARWLAGVLSRESRRFGTRVEAAGDEGVLSLDWD